MTEDFIGKGGKLEEAFVEANDSTLKAEVFTPFEVRAAKDKPQLLEGLTKLKTLMGAETFNKYINPVQNINLNATTILVITGNEQLRTVLTGKYVSALKEAFNVSNVKIIGGGRYGVDAF